MPETAYATIGLAKGCGVIDFFPTDRRHTHDDQLGDPVPAFDEEGFRGIGVEQRHHDLAAVAAVDQPWCVHDSHSVAGRKSTAREHEPAESDRQSEGEPDRNDRSATGRWTETRGHIDARDHVPALRQGVQDR